MYLKKKIGNGSNAHFSLFFFVGVIILYMCAGNQHENDANEHQKEG